MKAIVVGTGNMGTAIAYAISKLGFDIQLIDPNVENIKNCENKLNKLGVYPIKLSYDIEDIFEADIVISAATYKANYFIAKKALEQGIPYCDLGGDPDVSRNIANLSNDARLNGIGRFTKTLQIFTDLGLAPGLVNIIAENSVLESDKNISNVIMRVGGLPLHPTGKLQYGLTWSLDGLRNEYKGDCEVLKNGEFVVREALSDYDTFDFQGVMMESFNTKGGMAHSLKTMENYGVSNCSYKTIRYIGHAYLISFLLQECKLNDDDFDNAILNACQKTEQDQVLIAVDVDEKQIRLRIISDSNWTAMQKATAFPTACVASLMADGLLGNNQVLSYNDVPLTLLSERLLVIDDQYKLEGI